MVILNETRVEPMVLEIPVDIMTDYDKRRASIRLLGKLLLLEEMIDHVLPIVPMEVVVLTIPCVDELK